MKRSLVSLSIATLLLFSTVPLLPQAAVAADLQGWVQQVSGVTENLVDVQALDADTAWAVGWSDTILKTTNGGADWNPQVSGTTSKDLQDISAVNGNTAWAVGHGGTIIVTVNGGTTWTPPLTAPPIATTNLAGVHAFSALSVWAVGGSGTVIRTNNGGLTWDDQATPTTRDLFAISAADTLNAWAVGNEGALIHTTNGGATWVAQTATSQKLRGVHALSPTVAWICGFNGEIYKTYDAGATWNRQPTPTDNILYDIWAVDNDVAWSVGYDDFVLDEGITLKTTADGADWHFQYGSTQNLLGVSAVNSQIAWAVGMNGEILKTTNGGEWYRTWYLAEGATLGGFETWVLVQNPGTNPADVNITYMTDQGAVQGPVFQLAPESRTTVNVAETVQTFDVSTYVSSNAPVVAERAMYWFNRKAGHESIGTVAPATTWYLAEGATQGGFETWVLVQNPGAATANVNLTYMTENGAVPGPPLQIPAQSRQSVPVNATVTTYKVSTLVSSDQPVIAERAMYWNNRFGGHDSIGVNGPDNDWYLAEGATLGGFETWVLVQNPGAAATNVTLNFMTENGPVTGPTFSLGAMSRESIDISQWVQTFKVSTRVTSTPGPVIAERAMYWNGRIEGHDSIGVTMPSDTWYLAEGATLGGFETWILVQNPGPIAVDVDLTYMTDQGEVTGPHFSLEANSRESIDVGADLQTYNVSTRVTASAPVIAERAMYWNNRIGGHDSIGLGL
ncbi:MAG: hypothetical protein KKF41_14085 [Actinobacteria bacterium]|nr:hypothetical protein [Actinomycetota bacterium]MBU1942622.1 hypothetical protein [Actinomycetota bacterium]MBU2688702.1 hypothetical protein [Actinomycetota bacterium]